MATDWLKDLHAINLDYLLILLNTWWLDGKLPDDISDDEKAIADQEHSNYISQLESQSNNNSYTTKIDGKDVQRSGAARNIDQRDIPSNLVTPTKTPCFKSFKNLIRTTVDEDDNVIDQLVTNHFYNQNFGDLIEPIISKTGLSDVDAEKEKNYLKRFRFEYFAINAGSKTFKGAGQSLKKTSTNPEILIPLETVVVLST